jgi:uncharacterized membrane protein YqjE
MNLSQTDQNQSQKQNQPLQGIFQELVHAFQNLLRSEVHLARIEFEETAKNTARDLLLTVTFASVAILGILPFMAFLVIGLGQWLNENYWLSALIVSLVFVSLGSFLGLRFARRVKERDVTLSFTRKTLQEEAQIVGEKARKFSNIVKRRPSSARLLSYL